MRHDSVGRHGLRRTPLSRFQLSPDGNESRGIFVVNRDGTQPKAGAQRCAR